MNFQQENKTVKDFSWYFVGAIIPAIIGFIKSPIFTRHFTPIDYGYYSMAFITFNYISIGLYSWLSNNIWRYYLHYTQSYKIKTFLTNIVFLYIFASAIVFITTFAMIFFTKNPILQNLFLFAAIQIVFAQGNAMILIIYRIKGKAFAYNFINTIKTICSFGLLLLMTFIFKFGIEALFISLIALDVLLLIYFTLVHFDILSLGLDFKQIQKLELNRFFKFGFASLTLNFFLIVIDSNDRYIIAMFNTMSEVGIYNQLFNLGQITIIALIAIYQNSINPELMFQLENNIFNYSKTSSKFVLNYVIILLPITVLLSIFSKEFAYIFLGEKFRSGWNLLPWIFFAKFLTGLFIFSELKYKFQNKMTFLVFIFLSATIVSISLNFIFVPIYGYRAAVYSNFLSYFILTILLLRKDIYHYFSKKQLIILIPFIISLLFFWLIIVFLKVHLQRDLMLIEIIELNVCYVIFYSFLLLKYFKRHYQT